MSYVLNIWEQPAGQALPVDIREVPKLVDALFSQCPGVNPRIATLVRTLTQRYPLFNAMPQAEGQDEPRVNECAWSDGSMDGHTTHAVLSIGLNTSMRAEVQPFVAIVATALGLCVFDNQAGAAFFPGGRVLSAPQTQAVPEPVEEELPRSREVVRGIFERLVPLMKTHGFKARKGNLEFKRTFPGGWQEICLDYTDMWPVACHFSLIVSFRLDAVTDLAGAIASPNATVDDLAIRSTAVAIQQRWMADEQDFPKILHHKQHYELRTPGDVEFAIAHLASMFERKILPVLLACETLEGVDEILNPVPPQSAIFVGASGNYSSIIAAYLAKNPRLDEIIADVMPGRFEQNEGLQRCIAYVREQRA